MRKFNFKYINWVRRLVNGDEFKVLDFIENTMALKGCSRVQLYRATIAIGCGWSEKKVTRITDSLVEKGFLKKDLVSDGVKSVNWYTLIMDRFETECGQSSSKNENDYGQSSSKIVPLNNTTIKPNKTLQDYNNTSEDFHKTSEDCNNTQSIWKDVADWDNEPIPEVVGVLEKCDFPF